MKSSAKEEMKGWRDQIDRVDRDLVRLLNERTEFAIEIGKIKERHGIDIYDPVREEEVIRNVQSATNGPLTEETMQRLFERIIDETRRSEREFRARLKNENR
jgi:chorismate mutase